MPRTLVVTVNLEVVIPDDDMTSESIIAENVGLSITAQAPAILAGMFEDTTPPGYDFGQVWADPNYWKD
jgi:hypothetical protein